MHVHENQRSHFLIQEKTAGDHNIAKGLVPLLATIRNYLPLTIPLFAANPSAIWCSLVLFAGSLSTICRYLPLAILLFAANYNKLQLFAANDICRKLSIRVI